MSVVSFLYKAVRMYIGVNGNIYVLLIKIINVL